LQARRFFGRRWRFGEADWRFDRGFGRGLVLDGGQQQYSGQQGRRVAAVCSAQGRVGA
jgi:hypothetical protein